MSLPAAPAAGVRIACPCCGQDMRETDWRPNPPRWVELVQFIDGARVRGWTDAQIEYLHAAIGVVWAKAFARGKEATAETEGSAAWWRKP